MTFGEYKMSFVGDERSKTKQVCEVFTISSSTEGQPHVALCQEDDLEVPSDFDQAIGATGYGLFNILLLLASFPGTWASFFDMATMSYVIPSAECDLNLTAFHKGILNAVTYAGMMTSAFVWGFFADTKGRRSLLRFGYLADSICNILCSMSQSFYVLATLKFLTGFIMSGPFAINMTYLSEFTSTKYRSKTLLCANFLTALANMTLPALALAVISQPWSFTLFDGAFVYNSWRMFLLVCSMPALLAFLLLSYFPESPRFLMSQGRNEEALKVFQRMYAMNTRKPPETFPVKVLSHNGQTEQVERSTGRRSMSIWDKTRRDLAQIKPLFIQPYLCKFLLITIIQFGGILSLNTLRLWMPQLFTMMENFDYENRDPGLGAPSLCEMMTPKSLPNATMNDDLNSTMIGTCVVTPVNSQVYINSLILAVASVLGYMVAGSVINLIGKKNLLLILYGTSALCSLALNWSPNTDVTLALFAIYVSFTGITIVTIISVIVDLIPTSLRAMSVSMTMCIGRGGAVFGNLLFPLLLSTGCMVPFMFVGGFLVVCFTLTIFIPKPPAKLL